MTIKTSSAVFETAEIPIPDLQASTAAFERAFPFGSEHLTHKQITQLELDSFQVALVPFQSPAVGAGRQPMRNVANHLVLLDMTWKQLMLQVREETNRGSAAEETEVVRFGEVSVDLVSMEVRRSNRLLNLTAMEFKVLRFFVANPNRVISRDELLDQVWGYENYPCTRTVDNHILRLRQKLEMDFANPTHFRTVHGVGYKFIP
jgi:DNA-binding winged helix-turn-helix (wHTH) protein